MIRAVRAWWRGLSFALRLAVVAGAAAVAVVLA